MLSLKVVHAAGLVPGSGGNSAATCERCVCCVWPEGALLNCGAALAGAYAAGLVPESSGNSQGAASRMPCLLTKTSRSSSEMSQRWKSVLERRFNSRMAVGFGGAWAGVISIPRLCMAGGRWQPLGWAKWDLTCTGVRIVLDPDATNVVREEACGDHAGAFRQAHEG